MLRIDRTIGTGSFGAACVALAFLSLPAWAQAQNATAPPAATKSVVSAADASPKNKSAKKRVVSPYARAAAQREHAGQAPAGHSQTMVQGMGKPRKPHPVTPSK